MQFILDALVQFVVWGYAISILVLFVYGVNLLILSVVHVSKESLRPGRNELPGADAEPTHLDQLFPTVTVQLPIYNEALVAKRLIDACAGLTYPRGRIQIQVLDDSTDKTTSIIGSVVREWRSYGIQIEHIRRSTREGYKAGALAHGLKMARGDLIALFDADFIPDPDFLLKTVTHFKDPEVGLVQARWAHLNPGHSLLTRIQAFGLDTHFAFEQLSRSVAGCFINFNGTAGVWRKSCIEESGGWSLTNLTEDFDLSYRAQLAGWKFRFLPDVEVPAELPVSMNAFRNQQYRWTKGALQTAEKILGPLWRSAQPVRVKWEGTVHLTASAVFPFIALAAILYPPLIYVYESGLGPGHLYFAFLSVGLFGFLGFYLAQALAQRYLYPSWAKRLRLFPVYMAGSIGMSLNNSRAFLNWIRRTESPFVRTPKYNISEAAPNTPWIQSLYADTRIPMVVASEVLLACFSIAGMVYMIAISAWAALPFQVVFAAGFSLVAGFSVVQFFQSPGRGERLVTDQSVD